MVVVAGCDESDAPVVGMVVGPARVGGDDDTSSGSIGRSGTASAQIIVSMMHPSKKLDPQLTSS